MNRILVALVLLSTSPVAVAQSSDAAIRGQSEQTYKRLVEASRKLTEGKPGEAADSFLRIMDEAGDDLVSEHGTEYRPARSVAQAFLARMPADVLKSYRLRADLPARKLLEAGKKSHDPGPLRELIDRYFVSRPAEEALDLLGEYSFERGEYRTAEGYWRRLIPSTDTADLTYPDPTIDIAIIRARVILAVLFQGDLDRARQELARYEKDYPKATGRLAGKDGPFAETLKTLLARHPVFPAEVSGDGDWSSFGGSATRNSRTTARLPRYWRARETWKVQIPTESSDRTPVYALGSSVNTLPFHPVVLDGIAYIADSVHVWGFDSRTGEKRFSFDLRDQVIDKPISGIGKLPVQNNSAYALTTANGRLFVRLGSPVITATLENNQPQTSCLVGFSSPPRHDAASPPLRMEWILTPPAVSGNRTIWEGAPIWCDGRLYTLLVRFDRGQQIHAIACYDDPPTRPVWMTDVCETKVGQQDVRYRHELLTLGGGNVVFCSHSGVVVAVDRRSGKPSWALRYPKTPNSPGTALHRDVNPPIAADGRVLVAPNDTDQIFALDAVTGRVLWQKGLIQVNQLLGVSHGRLVCTIAGPNRGIRGLSVMNGSDREPEGWAVHDDQQLKAYGRGLVSDEFVLFPTNSANWGLRFLNPTNGDNERPPLPRPLGNLAYADGVLLAATQTELRGYVSERTQIAERITNATSAQSSTVAARDLALALADGGLWDEAVRAVKVAEPLVDTARMRSEWLADRAEHEIANNHLDEARTLLRQAIGPDYSLDWRVRAAGRLLSLEPKKGGRSATDRFLLGLGQPADFSDSWVRGPDGVPIRLRELAAQHFGVPKPEPRSTPPIIQKPTEEVELGRLHRLGPDATIVRETVFPSVQFVPLLPIGSETALPSLATEKGIDPLLLVTDGKTVLAFRPGESRPVWEAVLLEGATVTHATTIGDTILIAGAHDVLCLSRTDGSRTWAFRFPDAEPLPFDGPRPIAWTNGSLLTSQGLSDFALSGSRLVARIGDCCLIGIDITTGSVAWARASTDNSPRSKRIVPYPDPTNPRFNRFYLADDRGVLVQLSNGQRWTLDSVSGRTIQVAPTTLLSWSSPPIRLGSGRIAVSDGPALVNSMEPDPTRIAWTFDGDRVASQTGQPPQLLAVHDGLIVAVSRNHGIEIERLLGAGGTRIWQEPGSVLIPEGQLDLTAADTDSANLFVPVGEQLTALRMIDGRTAWVANLSSLSGGCHGPWRVRAGRKTVIAYPMESVPTDRPNVADAVVSFALRPGGWRVPSLAVALYHGWLDRTVPVLFLDSESGQLRRRIVLRTTGPVIGTYFDAHHSVVVTAGRAFWLK